MDDPATGIDQAGDAMLLVATIHHASGARSAPFSGSCINGEGKAAGLRAAAYRQQHHQCRERGELRQTTLPWQRCRTSAICSPLALSSGWSANNARAWVINEEGDQAAVSRAAARTRRTAPGFCLSRCPRLPLR